MEKFDNSDMLNMVFLGEVASVLNYGAFVRIPGNKNQGLVHKSQVSKAAVDDVTEILQKGERVWCKVINVSEGKIALSMKVVDQGSGRDLDPNGVQIHQDEQKRKSMPYGGGRKVIPLEAVLKTTCSRCGITGHLSKDCFQSASGKVYELIPEDDVLPLPSVEETSKEKEKTKEKKLKKPKKRKKEKKHKREKKKRKSSHKSSESDSSSDDWKRREKKKRKIEERSRSLSPKRRRK